MSVGQSNLENSSLRLSSQMILHCVKLIINTNHQIYQNAFLETSNFKHVWILLKIQVNCDNKETKFKEHETRDKTTILEARFRNQNGLYQTFIMSCI